MTQKQKELLLKVLCAGFPYRIICTDNRHGDSRITDISIDPGNGDIFIYYFDFDEFGKIENCKPYLRPMSSMTQKENKEYLKTCNGGIPTIKSFDWLNKNHFDYLGLIENGLALKAPDGMYNISK